jgi:hypothetical protein
MGGRKLQSGEVGGVAEEVSKHFFLRTKRSKKTFMIWTTRVSTQREAEQKFFSSFFQKRTAYLTYVSDAQNL